MCARARACLLHMTRQSEANVSFLILEGFCDYFITGHFGERRWCRAPPPSPTPPDAHRLVVGLLLLQLLHQDAALLVLAPLVLEPHAYDARAEARHLHQLLLHERVGPRVGVVAGPQRVQLLLVEHRAHARGLLRLLVDVGPERGLPGRDGFCCGERTGHTPEGGTRQFTCLSVCLSVSGY